MSDLAKVTRHMDRGMITLRGDLASAAVAAAVEVLTGQSVPVAGKIAGDGALGVVWMSPDELLVLMPYAQVDEALNKIATALGGTHHLAVDVSDARAVFTVAGAQAHEVLARLCPVDLHRNSFGVGDFRRSRLAQVPAAFWRHDTGFDVICFRSVGDYAEALLCNAATAGAVGALD